MKLGRERDYSVKMADVVFAFVAPFYRVFGFVIETVRMTFDLVTSIPWGRPIGN